MRQSDGNTLSHMGQSNDKIDQTYVKQREHIVLHWDTELHNNARLAIYKYREGSVFHSTPHSTIHCVLHCQDSFEHWSSEISNVQTKTMETI